jgi:Domain of unknown function (DUF4383)
VTRQLKVELGQHGRSSLSEEAASQGTSVEKLAAYAVLYYLADLDCGRSRPTPAPEVSSPQRRSTRVRIELEEFGWTRLSEEAARQGVSPEAIAARAISYYLAEPSPNRIAHQAPPFLLHERTSLTGLLTPWLERSRRRTRALLGPALLVLGILGFVASGSFATGEVERNHLFGLFAVNGWHNLVHLASGLLLLLSFWRGVSAKLVATLVAAVYGLVALYGLLGGSQLLGLIPLNTADNILHVVLTALALFTAFLPPVRRPSRPPRTLRPS